MDKEPIEVYIVDDSLVSRELLMHIIASDPRMKVAGYAADGEEALLWLKHNTPDVITMDIFMPKLNGIDATRRIMKTKPVPIVIVSSAWKKEMVDDSFKALEAGALAILEKPVGLQDPTYYQRTKEILDTIAMVSEVKLVKRRTIMPLESIRSASEEKCALEAIGIGASLGGPPAIASILASLPARFPIPIYVVQHIATGFTEGFAKWLQNYTSLEVLIARENSQGIGGCCYIAPDNCQMQIRHNNLISLHSSELGISPSVNVLFRSLAEAFGANAVGVLLTGMGKDGAQELLTMKRRGAITIAQNEESCVMFGMPKEAIELGAASMILPLEQIGSVLEQLSKRVKKVSS